MRLFLLPETVKMDPGRAVKITGRDHHYLVNVLRLRAGDRIRGTDGRGTIWRLTVEEVGTSFLSLRADQPETQQEGPTRISLFQCLPKGRKMDTIVRQATEVGVCRIIPVMSERAVLRLDQTLSKDGAGKVRRWRRIAREALQQCGTARLPDIEEPLPLRDALRKSEAEEARVFFHQQRLSTLYLHQVLSEVPKSLALFIGPEGGFSEEEVGLMRRARLRPLYIGDNILRTETAALFGLAAVCTILQERSIWSLAE